MVKKKDVAKVFAREVDEKHLTNKSLDLMQDLLNDTLKVLTPDKVYQMASIGVSAKNICQYHTRHFNYINENPELLDAFNRGRAYVGSKIRSSILDDALEKDSLQAKIYLDKIYGGDTETLNINATVTPGKLDTVPTETLLNINLDDDTD